MKRVYIYLAIFFLVLLGGSLLFMMTENLSFTDAVYFTISDLCRNLL